MRFERDVVLRLAIGSAKLAVFGLLAWFLYRAWASGSEALDAHPWHVEPGWLVLSGVLYLLGQLPSSIFWQRVLVSTGQRATVWEAVRAYYISQLGKYVPGKWMVIVLRRALLPGEHVENTVVAATVFYETFTLLSVGAALSAILLAIWLPQQVMLVLAAIGACLLMGVPIVPSVFRWLMRVLGVGKLNATAADRFQHIPWRTIFVGWVLIAVGWVIQGAALWATLRGMEATADGPLVQLPLHTATVALSVVAGFLSQIPGGLVVREWVSMQLVEPQYGAAVAAVSVIIFRLVLLVSELLIAACLYATMWPSGRKSNLEQLDDPRHDRRTPELTGAR